MDWAREWSAHAGNPFVLYGSMVLFVGGGYIVWRVCRTIVTIGYFVAFSALGFMLASGASLAFNRAIAPLPVLVTAGISFGLFVCLVRSKVLKVVGAVTALIVAHTVGTFWLSRGSKADAPLLPAVAQTKKGH